MTVTYEDLIKANEGLKTTPIERYNKKAGKKETKDYVDVAQRVKAFRRAYPMGFIITNIISTGEGVVTTRTEVGYYEDGLPIVIASGTANEVQSASPINQTSFIEVCETSSVGRALGYAGFGIDSGIASADEMRTALKQQEMNERKAANPEVVQEPEIDMNGTIEDTPDAVRKLKDVVKTVEDLGAPFMQELKTVFNIERIEDVPKKEYREIVRYAQKRYEVLMEEKNNE